MKPERLTPLRAEFVDDHGTHALWTLLTPLEYYSALLDERIEVPAGFVTDLASVPRLIVAYSIFGGHASWEAVVHDYLYRTRLDLSERLCDDVFLEAMISDGEPAWRRQLMYRAVRWFGRRKKTVSEDA